MLSSMKEDESIVQQLNKSLSDLTAALFALELLEKSDTARTELAPKVSKLLTEVAEELKKSLHLQQP
jgi:SAM-dependent MidA family methyltransferase